MGSVLESVGIGFGGGSFAPGGTTTSTDIRELPGIFGGGREKATQIGGQIEQLLGAQPEFLQQLLGGGGALGQLRSELAAPSFGPQTSSEQALLGSILDLTQGQTATRGLGPATQGALGQAIAPTLVGLQQQRVGNLAQALGLETGLAGLEAGGRGQQLGGLLELAGLAAPQPLVTQTQRTKQPGLGTSLLGGLTGGIATGLGQRIAQP